MKSILPIIFVILALTGAITFSLAKRNVPKQEESRFGIPANQLETNSIDNEGQDVNRRSFLGLNQPTATPTIALVVTPTSNEITPLPTVTENDTESETKGGQTTKVTEKVTEKVASVVKTTKTTVCTPVYGQANTCTEHIVVDTGAESAMFFNFAGLSYLAGLASFIKAKTIKK